MSVLEKVCSVNKDYDLYHTSLIKYNVLSLHVSVGYILGLGDRHVMNILIDCKTAELIHIDLGENVSHHFIF